MEQRATEAHPVRRPLRLAALPLGVAAGAVVSLLALTRWDASPFLSLVYGVVAALLALYGREWLAARIALLLEADPDRFLYNILPLTLDALLGAAVGLAAAPLLDASSARAIGTGAALAGVWSFVVGRLLYGGGVDRAVDFMLAGSQGADFAREPILADGQALEREGHVDAAIARYREVAERTPADPEPYLRAAHLLRQQGRALEAVQLLHLARRRARLSSGHELMIGQALAELAAGPLGDPAGAASELALLVARFAGTPPGEAARRELAALQARQGAAVPGGPGRPVTPGEAAGGSAGSGRTPEG